MDSQSSTAATPQMPMQPQPSSVLLSGRRLSANEVERACRIARGVVAIALGQPRLRLAGTGTAGRGAALARQIAMYLAHVGFGLPMAQIGKAFGRDRTTVVHACHVIEDRRDVARFDAVLDHLEQAAAALLAASKLNRQR
jgi:hypothetical protein